MDEAKSLCHTWWDCKHLYLSGQVVFYEEHGEKEKLLRLYIQ